MYYKLEELKQW